MLRGNCVWIQDLVRLDGLQDPKGVEWSEKRSGTLWPVDTFDLRGIRRNSNIISHSYFPLF